MPAILAYLGQEPWSEPQSLSEQLRQARIRRGLTQAQAAGAIGVDEGTVWWWEAGRRPRRQELKQRLVAFISGPSTSDGGIADSTTGSETPSLFDLGRAMRRRRRELGLTQEQAAERLGVNTWTVLGWENGGREPMDRFYPVLIRFLEEEPWTIPVTVGQRLRAERRRRGLSQEQAASVMQVNPDSIAAWEAGQPPRHQLSKAKIEAFLEGGVRPWRCGRLPTGHRKARGR